MQNESKDSNEDKKFEIIGLDNFIKESKKKHFTSNERESDAKRVRFANGIKH